MIIEGSLIKFLELPIFNILNKKGFKFPISSYFLFNQEESFCFSNFTEICQRISIEDNKTKCHTQHFIIDLENAIQYKEIEITENNQWSESESQNAEIKNLKNELIELYKNHQQGFLTEKEFNNQIIDRNTLFCLNQNKWNNLIQPLGYIGGVVKNPNNTNSIKEI